MPWHQRDGFVVRIHAVVINEMQDASEIEVYEKISGYLAFVRSDPTPWIPFDPRFNPTLLCGGVLLIY
jgi:hypothetical protein